MKKFKQAKLLPMRGALNELTKAKPTITDYAKALPNAAQEPAPNILQNARKGVR